MRLMEQAADEALGLDGDGGMEVQAAGVGVIEFAQPLGMHQGRIIGRGRVLDGQHGG